MGFKPLIRYFDFNVPVITNTAYTTFYQCPESVNILGPLSACYLEDVMFESSVTGYDFYAWSVDGVVSGSDETFSPDDLAPGSHILELETNYNDCELSAEITLDITVAPLIESLNEDTLFCNEGNIEVISEIPVVWTQDGVNFNTDQVIKVTESGTYFAMATNACGTQSVGIYVEIVDVPDNVAIEVFEGYLYSGATGISYLWYLNGNLVQQGTEQYYEPLESGNYTLEVIFSDECSLISNVLVLTIGIAENEHLLVSLSPNPADDFCNLFYNGNTEGMTMSVRDVLGRELMSNRVTSSNTTIDCSGLNSGVYFVVISDGGRNVLTLRLTVR